MDILARQFGVLLMHGAPFGAPNYMRLSYANLLPDQVSIAVNKLKQGVDYLQRLSNDRALLADKTCIAKKLSNL